MEKLQKIRDAQRSVSPACILSIGTAFPSHFIYQKDYPDYYFRVTNSEDKVEWKAKFQRICDKTKITKRHFLLTEEMLKANPNMLTFGKASHDARRALAVELIPKLGVEAAENALKDWGHPKSKITHLIVYTTLALSMPGADFEIARLLGLHPSVHRQVFYLVGCNGGVHVLRHAKDIVENNKGARVLVVCSESTIVNFHGPDENEIETLIGQALFADGAAAAVVGSDPDLSTERPLFHLVHGIQTTVRDTRGVGCEILEMGQTIHLNKDLPYFVAKNVEICLQNTFKPLGINDWNSLFWVCHNGGKIVLDQTETECKLEKGKLDVSRDVLSEYGNMSSVAVYVILDEMRKRSVAQGKSTTGLGSDWGVMFGFGPGLTVESLVLHSVAREI